MFHRSLRSFFLLVIAAAAAAASPARAVVDVDTIDLTITIERSTVTSDDIRVEFRVKGEDLNNGTVALPSAPATQIALEKDGDDLVLEDDLSNETELNTILPNGNYVFRFNNGSVQTTAAYTRPAVPSPAITQPAPGEVVLPGPIEVLFTNCSVCNLVGDSVVGQIFSRDAMDNLTEIAEETLTSSDESWVPQDGMGDLQLAPESLFAARITHRTIRQSSPSIDDDDDVVVFSGIFVQSDENDFETGFEPPEGTVCISISHPMPPAGCSNYANPLLRIVDSTGSFTTQIDGHDVDVNVTVDASGSLSGSASADLDDNAVNETGPSPIKGKLGGRDEERSSKLSFSLENPAFLAKLKLSIVDEYLLASDTQNRTVRGSGSLNGMKIKEESLDSDSPIPTPVLGWYVSFDVDGSSDVSNAMLVLEGGRSFPLGGTNKFNFAADETGIKLSSDPKGISIQLKKLLLGDGDPVPVGGGDLSFRILGQSGRASLGGP